MDALFYAQFLITHVDKNDYAHVLENISVLADLARQKHAVIARLTENQLSGLVNHLPHSQTAVIAVLHDLHRHHQIASLPKIRQAFVRQLEQNGYSVAEVTSATSDVDTQIIAKAMGPMSVIITQTDPSLIAGLRVTTSHGSYEYSTRAQLHQIREALAGNQKGQ